jgi:hypothetical protein
MFKFQNIASTSFPGPQGLQKNLASVNKNDARVRDFLEQLPPELHVSERYTPLFGEAPLQVIRRYALTCTVHGHLLTLHRPYTSKSPFSKDAAISAAWTLVTYQNQISALSNMLEPYSWYIEEFLDPHLFRATLYLGGNLLREPVNPQAAHIRRQIQISASQAKAKALRKRDYAKTYGLFDALDTLLGRQAGESNQTAEVSGESGVVEPNESSALASDGLGWDVGEMLTENAFRWDDFLVDMDLDSQEQLT